MSAHEDFYDHLGTIQPNGAALQQAYDNYKNSNGGVAFQLNGKLKAGIAPNGALAPMFNNLRLIIRATNNAEITLWRMTSDVEFVGPLAPVIFDEPFRYPAFLSTAGKKTNLHAFAQNIATPLLLKVVCPAGTPMALLEKDGGMEDEYLLGDNTTYSVTGTSTITDADELMSLLGIGHHHQELRVIELAVAGHPPYTVALPKFAFDQDVEEEPEVI